MYSSGEEKLGAAALPHLAATEGTWLESTRDAMPVMPKYSFAVGEGGPGWYLRPVVWAGLFLGVIGFVCLVVLW